jgi:superfamily II DNA or RNA helicase
LKQRFYQEQATQATIRNITNQKRDNLIVIGVGGGKSVTIAHLALWALDRNPGTRALIVSHRKVLDKQNAKKISAIAPQVRLGYERASEACNRNDQIMVASIDTIGVEGLPRVTRWCDLSKISIVLIDEAHHIPGTKGYQVLLKELRTANPEIIIVGFTGTPKRGDGERIDQYIAHLSYQIGMQQLTEAGYLARLRCTKVKTSTSLHMFANKRTKEFQEDKLAAIVDNPERNQLVAAIYNTKHPGAKAMVFAVNKQHAQNLAATLTQNKIRCVVITDDTPDKIREELNLRLDDNTYDVVISIGCLSEGYDYPKMSVLFMCRPTKSPALLEQLLGRGSRLICNPNPNDLSAEWIIDWKAKTYFNVYDFVDLKAEQAGCQTVAKVAGLNPDFDLNGDDVFDIKAKLDEQTHGNPLLANALASALSLEEINKLLCSHDLLAEISCIQYTHGSSLPWVQMQNQSSWLQLSRGEVIKTEQNALGQYVLQVPSIDVQSRLSQHTDRQNLTDEETDADSHPSFRQIGPKEIILSAESEEEAREQAEKQIQRLIPSDYYLLRKDANWRNQAANEPLTEKQKWKLSQLQIQLPPEKLQAMTKAQASDLITKAELQHKLMIQQRRIHFGKYKGTPLQLIQLFDPGYLVWLTENPHILTRNQLTVETIHAIQTECPLEWLKSYRPRIYAKDYAGMEKRLLKDFREKPEDFNKTLKWTFENDPTKPWAQATAHRDAYIQKQRLAKFSDQQTPTQQKRQQAQAPAS